MQGDKSHLPFRAKVFVWRAIIGGLTLVMDLKRRHISNGKCFSCTVVEEDGDISSLHIWLLSHLGDYMACGAH